MSKETVYYINWRVEDGDGRWSVIRGSSNKPSRVFYESDFKDQTITAKGRAKLEAKRLARNNCPAIVSIEGEETKVC